MAEFGLARPGLHMGLRVEVIPPCDTHGATPCACARQRSLVHENPYDTPCVGMLETIGRADYFGSNLGYWSGTLISIGSVQVGTINGAPYGGPMILAGTVSTAPTFQDWQLGGQVPGASGSVQATIQPITTAQPTAGTVVTIQGNIQNLSGATIEYTEVGLAMAFLFDSAGAATPLLLTHDVFTGTIVPPNGVLAVTYDFSLC